jgi:tetratricopeptide (TPR) repeat protein
MYSYIEGVGLLRRHNEAPFLDRAVAALEAAVAADSAFAPAHSALGWAYWRKFGKTKEESWIEKSRDNLAYAIRLAPDFLQPRIYTGRVECGLGETEGEIEAYLGALKLAPGNPDACRWLGECYRKQKRLDEAEAVLRRAILRHPDLFWVHQRLGLHYYRLGLIDEAVVQFEKILELAPHNSHAMNTLGAIHYNRGQWTEARELFEQSVRLWPGCQTYSNVGLMLYYEGKFEQSADNYKMALQWSDSTEHYVWGNWASVLYWVEGQREFAREILINAIDLAERELENTPDEPGLIARLIDYYSLRDDETSTRAWIKRAGRHAENNADVMFSIGCAYERLDERELALRYIGDALRHDYPKAVIMGTPQLKELVTDDRFLRLINEESTPADSSD